MKHMRQYMVTIRVIFSQYSFRITVWPRLVIYQVLQI